jgi:esterase/lipase
LRYTPVLDRLNTLSKFVYAQDGIKPFQLGEPEHPEYEYRNMPVRSLVELRKMVDELSLKLPEIICPVSIIHGSNDPIVDPDSAKIIHEKVGSLDKQLHIVKSDRHSILHDDIDNTQGIVIARLSEFVTSKPLPQPVPTRLLPNINANFMRLIAPLIPGRKTTDDKRASPNT